MRFLLYNIRYATGTGWRFHFPFPFSGYLKRTDVNFENLVQFIKSTDPDIIGLLEVDTGSFRSRQKCQVTRLATELDHFSVHRSKYSAGSVWSRLPLTSNQGNALLTNRKFKNQRLCLLKMTTMKMVSLLG